MDRSSEVNRVIHNTLLGDALGNGAVAALLADAYGQYVAANDQACYLTGYDREALVQFRAGELAGDEDSRDVYHAIQRGKIDGIKVIRRRDGMLVRCRYWAVPTKIALTPHFLLLLRSLDPSAAALTP